MVAAMRTFSREEPGTVERFPREVAAVTRGPGAPSHRDKFAEPLPSADEFRAAGRSALTGLHSQAPPCRAKGATMADPVVHFEIIGKDPERLRSYFGDLFGWEFDTSAPVAEAVSEPANYGFVNRVTTSDGTGIPGGVGGGANYQSHVLFYIGVPAVEAALAKAESLGGQRRMGPERAPTGLVVGHFTDPEGNLIGVAGPA